MMDGDEEIVFTVKDCIGSAVFMLAFLAIAGIMGHMECSQMI